MAIAPPPVTGHHFSASGKQPIRPNAFFTPSQTQNCVFLDFNEIPVSLIPLACPGPSEQQPCPEVEWLHSQLMEIKAIDFFS